MPGPRPVHPRDHERAQPHHQPPGLARHQRPRARRDHGVLLLLPRAREGPRPGRDDRRRAHEHPLLPGGRLRRRHAPRLRDSGCATFIDEMPGAHRRVRGPAVAATRSGSTAPRASGVLPADQLIDLGVTGPALRAAGVDLDLRKAAPYSGYEHFDFQVPLGVSGDAYDRYTVRVREMRESVRIIGQALDGMPEGGHIADDRKVVLPPRAELATSMEALIHHFKLVTEGFRVPEGEAYCGGREPPRRARLLRGGRRLAQAAPRAHARPQLREPAGAAAHGQGRLPRRPDHDDRLARQRDGRASTGDRRRRSAPTSSPMRDEYAEAALADPAGAQVRPDREGPPDAREDLAAVAEATGFSAGLRRERRLVLRPPLPAAHRARGWCRCA